MFTKSLRAFVDPRPRFVHVETDETDPVCKCGERFPKRRKALGKDCCLACSPTDIKLAQAPLHKQGYGYVSDVSQLSENCYATHK